MTVFSRHNQCFIFHPMAPLLVMGGIMLIWCAQVIWANTDLTLGRHVLFMDERISFDGIMDIYNARNWEELFKAIIGPDQRYGRLTWILPAVVAYIPTQIGGDTALIVSVRMFHALCLMAAYLIFIYTFIKKPYLRALALACLLCLPTTSYYAHMPKPEPLQILFLSLFFRTVFAGPNPLGWGWIFYGLAFGMKISALSIAPIVGLAALVRFYRQKNTIGSFLLSTLIIPCAFIAGWMIAVPGLLYGEAKRYVHATILGTKHGSDSETVTVMTWLDHVMNAYVTPYFWASIIVSIVLLALPPLLGRKQADRYWAAMAMWASGLLWMFLIMLGVDRIWNFYLHPGLTLCLVGAVACIDTTPASRIRRIGFWAFVIVAILFTAATWHKQAKRYIDLGQRTQKPIHDQRMNEYNTIFKYLENYETITGRSDMKIYWAPHLYLPRSHKAWQIRPFWGPFKQWNQEYDIIILQPSHTDNEQYAAHTMTQGQERCTAQPCYLVAPLTIDTIQILELQ